MTKFCVVFRTGGTENFQWKRSLPMPKKDAILATRSVSQAGYVAMMENYAQSVSIGLPETFEYEVPMNYPMNRAED